MVGLTLIAACHSHQSAPSQLSPDILILPGAVDLHTTLGKNFQRATYRISVSYPAKQTIGVISNHLKRRGWKPLLQNWYNRDDTSSFVRGWVNGIVVPRGRERFASRWWAQWRNTDGEVIDYTLIYISPSSQRTNDTDLEVLVNRFSKPTAESYAAKLHVTGNLTELPPTAQPNSATATDQSPNPREYWPRKPGGA
jgi:hypothetical protein